MSQYVGIQTQIWKNNTRSVLLLIAFPLLLLAMVWVFIFLTTPPELDQVAATNDAFINAVPWVILIAGGWFLISWFMHSSMINRMTGSRPLERKDNKRVYNLLENLCIQEGVKMPKMQVIEDDSLNAFASGINEKTYTITVTRGLINKLNDEELEGVIAHELAHIKNRDVRLLIISLIFVGIFAVIGQIAFRSMIYSSLSRGGGNRGKGGAQAMIIVLVLALVAYFFSLIFRFALSRKREYMADASAAQMTRNSKGLASALRKISGNPKVKTVKSDDVAEMFIENQPDKSSGIMSFISGLFATHPPIDKRIKALEQY